MSQYNDDKWTDERSFIKDSAFNRGVNGVRSTNVGMKAMSSTQTMRAANSTQARMPALPHPGAALVPPQLQTPDATVQYFLQQAGQQAPAQQPVLTEEQVDQLALHDPETRAYNFRFLVRMLVRELHRATHYGRPFSILVIALNDLRQVESKHGLLAYSLAMKTVGQTLLDSCGPIDMVGRYQADRFLLLLPERDLDQASAKANQICQSFRDMVIPFQQPIKIPASIGVASYCEDIGDLESLLAMADLGAELVVNRGGDGYCFAPTELYPDQD